MRVLLVTPPMVQFNTVYPAVPALAAFVQQHEHEVAQEDLSLALALKLFSVAGIDAVARSLRTGTGRPTRAPRSIRHFLANAERIRACIEDAVRFLQGNAPELAADLVTPGRLPEGPRFRALRGLTDGQPMDAVARHRASVLLDEIADAVRDGIDERFELARYAEHLAIQPATFAPIAEALSRKQSLLDRWVDELGRDALKRHEPRLVGFTVPFPGALYGAFRLAKCMKRADPELITVLGGGYVNTELRDLDEPRVFDSFDFVTYDDGELPLMRIIDALREGDSTAGDGRLLRTRVRRNGRVMACGFEPAAQANAVLRHRDRPAPDFSPLARHNYLPLAESPNPMHRLWSERPWIKLTLAHGCYWHRCAFCDTSLDYIGRYDPADEQTILGWMETAIANTGLRGFHFVDEAAPPALLGRLARALVQRGLRVDWWANIRFEKQFTPELATLLRQSGCLAMSGGLECANDRLLALMDKGVDTQQAQNAMQALSSAGILVHAYLMYGYPTQTAQEVVDALDFVRRQFAAGRLQSAYWHRFALTAHSPAFRDASKLRLRILDDRSKAFTRNEIPFDEPGRGDPGVFGEGLRRAVYNFMHGVGLDEDVRSWFDFPVPRPRPRARSAADPGQAGSPS